MKTLVLALLFTPFFLHAQVLFPGDANNDGRADHLDVLAVGLGYGQEGPPREPPFLGIDWAPKQFFLWPSGGLPATGINYGFSDCNGDGLVNELDMAALKNNYDSLQGQSVPPPQPYQPPDTAFLSALPRLVFQFDKDTATVQDTLTLQILYVQPPGLPEPESPLGVAFTLEFDEKLVKDSLTRIFFEPSATDLLFAAAAQGFADARALPPGRVEFGAAGKGAPGLSFTRPLGAVQFIVEDVILRQDTFFTNFEIKVSSPLMINQKEEVMLFGVQADQVVLFQEFTRTPDGPETLPVRCYPNPVGDWLYVDLPPETPLGMLQIVDARGRSIAFSAVPENSGRVKIAASGWPPGSYWLQVGSRTGQKAWRQVIKR